MQAVKQQIKHEERKASMIFLVISLLPPSPGCVVAVPSSALKALHDGFGFRWPTTAGVEKVSRR